MSRSVMARARSALNAANLELTHLLDIGEIPDGSQLDRKVQSALGTLYDAVDSIKATSRKKARLMERGPLVFPERGRDMRLWRMSNGQKAFELVSEHQASRYASAKKVSASTSLSKYRVMTARQYLEALEDAVIEEHGPERPQGYKRVRILV